ncbi:hypothetical protein RSOLAG1IB_05100 [Rhizoctonia solani AG-1 IB]|uniref:Uncharacterized protein n=1 Tax=Thanatephorus cucumeris (strain AG1-IB / isolate 7/3/14) TaxID=1108050 RepID=A0A0B7G2M9_THACB|nr:hypothetical protein RSOLAG1IB_05100 [Rhizoctonia solani AG-1 IB]
MVALLLATAFGYTGTGEAYVCTKDKGGRGAKYQYEDILSRTCAASGSCKHVRSIRGIGRGEDNAQDTATCSELSKRWLSGYVLQLILALYILQSVELLEIHSKAHEEVDIMVYTLIFEIKDIIAQRMREARLNMKLRNWLEWSPVYLYPGKMDIKPTDVRRSWTNARLGTRQHYGQGGRSTGYKHGNICSVASWGATWSWRVAVS